MKLPTSSVEIPPAGSPNCVGLGDCIYQVTARDPVQTNDNRIRVQNQILKLMDWTPNFTLQQATDWHFSVDDRNRIKVKF